MNFTRAAQRCHVSQPSLTRAIQLLEEEFGRRLIHREGDKTHLSELGRIVKPHLDQMFEQAEVATRRARKFKNLQKTRLKLGVMCTIAPTALIELVTNVRARHPGIYLEVVDTNAGRLYNERPPGWMTAHSRSSDWSISANILITIMVKTATLASSHQGQAQRPPYGWHRS